MMTFYTPVKDVRAVGMASPVCGYILVLAVSPHSVEKCLLKTDYLGGSSLCRRNESVIRESPISVDV
jgi:hypothetical protein